MKKETMKSKILAKQILKNQWEEILNYHCKMEEIILQLCFDQDRYNRYMKLLVRAVWVGIVLCLVIGGLLPWVFGIYISGRMGVLLTMILIFLPLIAFGSVWNRDAQNQIKIATYQACRAENFIQQKDLQKEFESWQRSIVQV